MLPHDADWATRRRPSTPAAKLRASFVAIESTG
jgi:hypothetical protein